MKVFITGVAGFIGSFTARALLKAGHDVIGIDNFDDFYDKRSKEFNLDLVNLVSGDAPERFEKSDVEPILEKLNSYSGNENNVEHGKFSFIEGDIFDFDLMDKIFEEHKPDSVVHLAALAGVPDSIERPIRYTELNVTGSVNILEMCRKYDVKNQVFASTSAVYGDIDKFPITEEFNADRAISPYGATKRMCEIMNYTYHHIYGINTMNLRFFTVYGPLQRPYGMAIQKFIRQVDRGEDMTIYGDGSMVRDYVYIDDITNAIILSLEGNTGYNILNVGSNMTIDLINLSDLIIKYMGKGSRTHLECPPTEVNITFAGIEKLKETLGFDPKVDIEEGVKRQIEVFEMMPKWYKEL